MTRPLSKTPARPSERIRGSKTNRKGSAAGRSRAKITFSKKTDDKIRNLVANYNRNNPRKKITLPTARKVVRRGMGAFSSTHRPGMSRIGWGIARLHAFMRKKSGSTTAKGTVASRRIKKTYVQDKDLI
jgi:hypothetical protein